MSARKRVLIVGAKFGEVYLNAFLRERPELELAGLMARGSPRARQLAQAFGVPLYTQAEQLPEDLDIACVVVRSAIVGGGGSGISEMLLQRGLHVIQEHPLHPEEVERLQRIAKEQHRRFWVNSFYPHTAAARSWREAAARIRRQVADAPALAQLTTSRQLLYSALDLLMQGGNWEPAQITVSAAPFADGTTAFRVLQLDCGNAQATVCLQTVVDPRDADQRSIVMHQCTLGWPAGYLSLLASYGPVVWAPALHIARHQDDARTLYQDIVDSGLSAPTVQPLHTATPSWSDAMELDGPDGVARLIGKMAACLEGSDVPRDCRSDYQLGLSRLWQRALRAAGPPVERELAPPQTVRFTEETGA